MTDTMFYSVGDEDVTDGTVENYDLDWGEPVQTRERTIYAGCPRTVRQWPYNCYDPCADEPTDPEDPDDPTDEPDEGCPDPDGGCGEDDDVDTGTDEDGYPIEQA